MKRMKRTGIYKASNVTYDPLKMEAKSYDWWIFLRRIGGKLVFNNYSYSNSTCKHQTKVRRLLGWDRELVLVECPEGLQNLKSGIDYYKREIESLEAEIMKPRTRKSTNDKRRDQICIYAEKIETILELMRLEEIENYSQELSA